MVKLFVRSKRWSRQRLDCTLYLYFTAVQCTATTASCTLHCTVLILYKSCLSSCLSVGVHLDVASGKHLMLLQNSWTSLPFFEVDEDDWYDSEAKVCFVNTQQTAVLPHFRTNDFAVAESGVVGAGVAEPAPVGCCQ